MSRVVILMHPNVWKGPFLFCQLETTLAKARCSIWVAIHLPTHRHPTFGVAPLGPLGRQTNLKRAAPPARWPRALNWKLTREDGICIYIIQFYNNIVYVYIYIHNYIMWIYCIYIYIHTHTYTYIHTYIHIMHTYYVYYIHTLHNCL